MEVFRTPTFRLTAAERVRCTATDPAARRLILPAVAIVGAPAVVIATGLGPWLGALFVVTASVIVPVFMLYRWWTPRRAQRIRFFSDGIVHVEFDGATDWRLLLPNAVGLRRVDGVGRALRITKGGREIYLPDRYVPPDVGSWVDAVCDWSDGRRREQAASPYVEYPADPFATEPYGVDYRVTVQTSLAAALAGAVIAVVFEVAVGGVFGGLPLPATMVVLALTAVVLAFVNAGRLTSNAPRLATARLMSDGMVETNLGGDQTTAYHLLSDIRCERRRLRFRIGGAPAAIPAHAFRDAVHQQWFADELRRRVDAAHTAAG